MRLFKLTGFLLLFLVVSNTAFAQIFNPVHWKKPYAKHVSGNEYDLYWVASIDNGWYVYSQFLDDGGPVPTLFEFEETSGVTRVGKVKESGKKKSGFDEMFEMDVTKYSKKITFKQRIKVADNQKAYTIKGGWEYMTCNDVRCLNPVYKEFAIKTRPVKKKATPAPNTNPITQNGNGKSEGAMTNVPPKDPSIDWSDSGLPVKWAVEGERINNKEYILTYTANVKNGWELYSASTGGSPMPLTIEYENGSERIAPSRRIRASGSNKVRNIDDRFGKTLTRYKDQVTFTQKITLKEGSRNIKGNLYYVASNSNSALPPQRVDFSLKLPSKISRPQNDEPEEVVAEEEMEEETEEEEAIADAGSADEDNGDTKLSITGETMKNGDFDYKFAQDDCAGGTVNDLKKTSNLWVFLLGLGGGLFALLTPCIYPMIPITVGFFTKRSKTRAQGIGNALAYGLSIIAIYVTLGLAVTGAFGPEALNKMSTNWLFNMIFFAVFVAFAFSFFGFFELTLPSSWSTWSDSAADNKGGLLGIFFMAFTLSLVSFSCTGPIIGSLLVQTAASGTETMFFGIIKVKPLLGMLGFSTALALPFALFALFPSWLNSIPTSGGWMNAVKVTLGFLELALALKFLSVVDLAYNLDFLTIELFLGLWILFFAGLAAYMFGLLKLPLDYERPTPNTGRMAVGALSLAFVAYLGWGLVTYQPLTLLSGLAPPVSHNLFRAEEAIDFPDCPQGIRCFKDYDEGVAYAKEQNLPIMIDFTGHGCVNCRKMEENVWGLENIKPLLAGEYVLISLYVDDRKKIDKPYRTENGTLIRNVGNKWAQFQIKNFNSNTQPLYVLTTADGKILNAPRGYTPNVEKYEDFLQCGLDRFKSLD